MVTVLSVFTDTSFKEIRLPNLVNTDYSFILYKNIFNIVQDLEIQLENINGRWAFVENSQYKVLKNNEKYTEKPIKDQDIFHIFTEESENITLIVKEVKYSISVFKKYTVCHVNEITIGKNKDMLPMLLGSLLMVYASKDSNSGVYMYSGLVMSGASAVIGVVWALLSIYFQNKEEKEEK